MHLLFVDESGSVSPKEKQKPDDKFVLGGIIISEDTWFKVNEDITSLLRKYNVGGEIKWRYFYVSENKRTSLSHLGEIEKERLRTDLFNIIARYKSIRIISVVADITKCYKRSHIKSDDDLYWYAYKRLIE